MSQMMETTARDRIQAAFDEFNSWRSGHGADVFQAQHDRGDRCSAALAYLCGRLKALTAEGGATPEQLADVIEKSLRYGAEVVPGR